MAFSAFTMSCNHHFHIVPKHFHNPKRRPSPISTHSPFPLPQSLVTTDLLCVPMGLPVVNISYKWSSICVLLGLAYFTQHNIYEVHPHGSVYQCFTPFL